MAPSKPEAADTANPNIHAECHRRWLDERDKRQRAEQTAHSNWEFHNEMISLCEAEDKCLRYWIVAWQIVALVALAVGYLLGKVL